MAQEGDQLRVWELCRQYVVALSAALDCGEGRRVRAVLPDAGCAAYLKQAWTQANGGAPLPFALSSLNDRVVVQPGDVCCVVCAPDPQGVESSQKVASACTAASEKQDSPVSCVLLNPRLASGDAGVGLNARRLRDRFVGGFTVAYSLRPFGQGTVFKRFPGIYKVFGPDAEQRERLVLLQESVRRPDPEEVGDMMLAAEGGGKGEGGEAGGMGLMEGLAKTVMEMQRFMRQLSN